jgi:hypothetical protein
MIVAPPSAQSALQQSGWFDKSTSNIRFLDHGQTTWIYHDDITNPTTTSYHLPPLSIQATTGALVGPPWQRRENGYILTCASRRSSCSSNGTTNTTTTATTTTSTATTKDSISLYIEPHVEFNPLELSTYAPVDIVITPTTGQGLPAFELVHGPTESIQLIETLRPRYIVPMSNGEIDITGLVAPLVTTVGSPHDFQRGMVTTTTTRDMILPTMVSVEAGKDIVLEL